jgi:UDP-N-acetylmuramyl pentapeptide phosphotransferase/UDP-N-acetylglucosamine-1-phosphate transferase
MAVDTNVAWGFGSVMSHRRAILISTMTNSTTSTTATDSTESMWPSLPLLHDVYHSFPCLIQLLLGIVWWVTATYCWVAATNTTDGLVGVVVGVTGSAIGLIGSANKNELTTAAPSSKWCPLLVLTITPWHRVSHFGKSSLQDGG